MLYRCMYVVLENSATWMRVIETLPLIKALICDEVPETLFQVDRWFKQWSPVSCDDALEFSNLLLEKFVSFQFECKFCSFLFELYAWEEINDDGGSGQHGACENCGFWAHAKSREKCVECGESNDGSLARLSLLGFRSWENCWSVGEMSRHWMNSVALQMASHVELQCCSRCYIWRNGLLLKLLLQYWDQVAEIWSKTTTAKCESFSVLYSVWLNREYNVNYMLR